MRSSLAVWLGAAYMSSALNTDAALVFADLDLASLCISPAEIEGLIKPLTKVVMSVHWYCAWQKWQRLSCCATSNYTSLILLAPADAFSVFQVFVPLTLVE